jgi:hypothetical protein
VLALIQNQNHHNVILKIQLYYLDLNSELFWRLYDEKIHLFCYVHVPDDEQNSPNIAPHLIPHGRLRIL